MTTVDGLRFTFNGQGEYTLLRSDDFVLQGRTSRVIVNGLPARATVFSSIAAYQKNPASDKIEFRIDASKTKIGI